MQIYIGSDHAGFEYKNKIIEFLKETFYEIKDFGPFEYNPDDDYPDFISQVANAVAENPESRGIILGGTGEGESIDANRHKGVRAVEYYGGNLDIVKLGREHNDANILSLGARFLSLDEAKYAISIFLNTKFTGDERHIRRINKLDN